MSTATFPLNKQEVATLRDALELYWGSLDPPSDDELPNADAPSIHRSRPARNRK
jgi:hypothetical protein